MTSDTFIQIIKSTESILVQNTNILNLPGWQVIDCDTSEDCYAIQASPCRPRCTCPLCGSLAVAKHGTQAQTLRDLPCHGK